MHLYNEAQSIALEAWEESGGEYDEAMDFIHQSCDGHEVSIYYHKGIKFCAEQDTSAGEQWLEDIDGITQEGDRFGAIACRIAFATLYCASCEALNDLLQESEPDSKNDGFIQDRTEGGYGASLGHKYVGTYYDYEEALEAIKQDAGPNYLPNVWFIDDHGGSRLVEQVNDKDSE